jgi:argininosuccinate lyase
LLCQEIVGPVAAKLHTGRSRNDQVATDQKLWIKEALADIKGLMKELLYALTKRSTVYVYFYSFFFLNLFSDYPIRE